LKDASMGGMRPNRDAGIPANSTIKLFRRMI
jgi:hypothetical protein